MPLAKAISIDEKSIVGNEIVTSIKIIYDWEVYCRKSATKIGSLLATQYDSETASLQAAQYGSKNWFAIGRTIQQRKLIRSRTHNSVVDTISLQAL